MADRDQKDDQEREPGESEKERVDRELIELLNELRVVLPGVQVLFAFLLTVPFSNGYSKITGLQRDVYFIALLCAAVATILLIAPSTYHRILFRKGEKRQLLEAGNRFTISGTVFLALSMCAAIYLITDVLYQVPVAVTVAIVALVGFGSVWYLLPIWRRLHSEAPSDETSD
jgi:uncharacterized protein DUF6328